MTPSEKKALEAAKLARYESQMDQITSLVQLLKAAHFGQPLNTQDIGALRREVDGLKEYIHRHGSAIFDIRRHMENISNSLMQKGAKEMACKSKKGKRGGRG